jgi:hypothetical protein
MVPTTDGRKRRDVAGDDARQAPGEPVDMMSRFREPAADVIGTGVASSHPHPVPHARECRGGRHPFDNPVGV